MTTTVTMTVTVTMTMTMTVTVTMTVTMTLSIIIKIFCSEQNIKMSYYLFNRQDILEKAKKIYSKEKAAEYYLQNKEAIKENARNRYKNLSEEEKTKSKSIKRKGIKN